MRSGNVRDSGWRNGTLTSQIERRPLVLLGVALVIGLTTQIHPFNLLFILPLLWLFRDLRSWSIMAAGLCLGVLLAPRPVVPVLDQSFVAGELLVTSVPVRQPFGVSFQGRFGGRPFLCVAPERTPVAAGDRWQAHCLLQPEKMPEDWEAGRLQVVDGSLLTNGPVLYRWAQGWRDSFQDFATQMLSRDDAQWLDFIWFKSSGLSVQDKDEIQRSASVSYLAASGVHTVLLGAFLMAVFCALRFPRPVQLALTVFVIALFYVAGGSQLSVLRAGLGFLLYNLAYLFKREPDTLSALAVADILYLLWDPPAVYSLGFQLVTAVVIGFALFPITLVRPDIKLRSVDVLWRLGYGPALILFFGEPILLYHLGSASLFGSFLGVALLIPLPFVMLGSSASFALWKLLPSFSRGILLIIVLPCLHLIRSYVSLTSGLPALTYIPSFSALWLMGYYALLLCVWRPRVKMA